MGIVLPHGVLFTEVQLELTIREELRRKALSTLSLACLLGIFFSTGIPTCVIISKKDNPDRSVLFIDASKEFRKNATPRTSLIKSISTIFSTPTSIARTWISTHTLPRMVVDLRAMATTSSIPRYVDTSEPEEEIDLNATFAELKKLEQEEKRSRRQTRRLLQRAWLLTLMRCANEY